MNELLLRPLQLITISLTFGLLIIGFVFVGIHFFTLKQEPLIANQGDVPFWLFSIVMVLMACAAAFLMGNRLLDSAIDRLIKGTYVPPPNAPPMALLSEVLIFNYRSAHLFRLMLVEGSGVMGFLLFLLSGDLLALIGPGIAISVLAALFPTQTKVTSWVNEQMERIEQARKTNFRDEVPQN